MMREMGPLARWVVFLALVAPAMGQSDRKTVRVFIFAGQSNMVGSDSRVGDIRHFPPFRGLEEPQPRVRFSYCIGRERKQRSDGWVPLSPVNGVVGPELSFARRVTGAVKAPIAIIKVAAGGTHLGGDWNPDEPGGFKLYPLALDWIRNALKDLERNKVRYRLEGFFWHQGENDMFDDGFRANYGRNLKRFIACWRRDLDAPKLPFFIGELCTKTIWGMDNRARMYGIYEGQREVCRQDPLATYVPTSHVGVEVGRPVGLHYHYGTLGQLQHGHSHARAYLESIGAWSPKPRELRRWPYRKGVKVKLFLLAGHRNMEGERAFRQELKEAGAAELAREDHKIAFKYDLGGGYVVSKGYEPLGPAGFDDSFGPELSFARTLKRKLREPFAIAKFTHSGSQIIDWTPEGSEAKERNLYPRFSAFAKEAVKELRAKGHRVEIAGVLYHLGENDMSQHPYRNRAASDLQKLIAQSRKDLRAPRLRWWVSQQPPTDHDSVNGIDILQQMKDLAAKDRGLTHLPFLRYPEQRKPMVLDTRAIVLLGEKLAEAVLNAR